MTALNVLDINEQDFQNKPELKSHLGFQSFLTLARKPGRVLVVDRTLERREMKSGVLLAASYLLSKRVHLWTEKRRVGIIFPPGLGGYLANLAVVLAGKVPVNLNFTLGQSSAEACIRKADIDCILSTERVRVKMPAFPWPDTGVVDMVDELKALPRFKAATLVAAMYVLPAKCLAKLLKVPSVGDREEAALLFTSGSSGEPKGVVLSHRNILGNCAQIDASGLLPANEKLIANLPIFHSFGFTVALWYPLLRGCCAVTLPSPLEVKKTADAIEAESATILLGTPTFFKPYLKRVNPEQLKSLKYVIAGAEKTPDSFADLWETTFGSTYLEGYGLTETAPVVSLNLPYPPTCGRYPGDVKEGNRRGSVGRLMPGHSAKLVHPETREALALDQVGLLYLKGPNVFTGYLDDAERTADVKAGDWFITGDLARFDADGFLYIEGRLSRFSKIGGEMVPHGTIEEALFKAYELLEYELPMVAVAGRFDQAKGETLVLIVAAELELEIQEVRQRLTAAGLPNLWIPKVIKVVEFIPTLVTGKLDLKAIQLLALES